MAGRRIYGVGVDIVKVGRIGSVLDQYGERFLKRAYNAIEREVFASRAERGYQAQVEYAASRWALKEACHKALSRRRFLFPDVCLSSDATGEPVRPHLLFCGELEVIMDEENIIASHASISHDSEYAIATVILETADL